VTGVTYGLKESGWYTFTIQSNPSDAIVVRVSDSAEPVVPPDDDDEFDAAAQTLNVTLSAIPPSIVVGTNIALKADVSGTAQGTIHYQFDCTNNGSYEVDVTNNTDPYLTNSCAYSSVGTYTARVRVERGTAVPAQSTTQITVSAPEPPIINDFWAEDNGGSSISGVCNIYADPKILVIPRNTSTLTWSCDGVINGCTLHDDNPKVPDMGAVALSGSEETPAIDATTTFTLQCPSSNNPSVTVGVFTPFLKEIIPQ